MNIKNVKENTITTFKKFKKGFWLRNPFYKKSFDLYGDDCTPLRFKNFFSKDTSFKQKLMILIVRLLNLPSKFSSLQKFIEENDNAAGFRLNSIRNPFYFERVERELFMKVDEFTYFHSWGYHYIDETVGGNCVKEITKGKINGIPIKNTQKDVYKYIYKHVVNDLLKDQGIIENFLK